MKLAGEDGVEVCEADAAEVLSLLRFLAGELTEVELDVVTGGSGLTMKKCPECGSASATLVGEGHGLELWRCNNCNTTFL